MRIIAYTYEADTHCIACTVKRYQANGFDTAPPALARYIIRSDKEISAGYEDANGIGYLALDYESNPLHPIFSIDEWQELDDSFLTGNPTQYLACSDCHDVIDEYTHEVA